MNKLLLIGCTPLLLGCEKMYPLPMQGHTVPVTEINVITAGQSNMTVGVEGSKGIPYHFFYAMKERGVLVHEINLAVSGSSQQDWSIGGIYYNNLIAQGKSLGKIDVLLWWQGEAEGATMYPPLGQPQPIALAQAWGQNFTAFVAAVRRDLGQPDLPVIYCQIGPNLGGLDSWDEVRRQQAEVSIPHGYFVNTDGANFHGWFHTDDDGYQLISKRIASVFIDLKNKS